MKTIQQYNNFRHSTYTPTQSVEDLTNAGSSSAIQATSAPQDTEIMSEQDRVPSAADKNGESYM